MKFWDTSAIAPLVIDEAATAAMRDLVNADPDVIVWMLSGVELLSALGRLGRQTPELVDLLPGVRLDTMDLFRHWTTVTHVEGVTRRAERLVGVHPLSAADALQLGAALLASGDRPETLPFVTLDRNLARAAQLEGFRVIAGRPASTVPPADPDGLLSHASLPPASGLPATASSPGSDRSRRRAGGRSRRRGGR